MLEVKSRGHDSADGGGAQGYGKKDHPCDEGVKKNRSKRKTLEGFRIF